MTQVSATYLLQEMQRMSQELVALNNRVAGLEDTAGKLIQQFLPPVIQRIQALEADPPAKATPTRKRTPTDYLTYCKITGLIQNGMSEKQVAAEMNIPYTTVRSYLRWDKDMVGKKKAEWDNKEGNENKAIVKATLAETTTVDDLATDDDIASSEGNPEGFFDPTTGEVYQARQWSAWTMQDRIAADIKNAEGESYWPVPYNTMVEVRINGQDAPPPDRVQNYNWGEEYNDQLITSWRLTSA